MKSPTTLFPTPEISMPVLLYQVSLVMIFCLQIAGDGLPLAQAVAHNIATQNALVPLAQIPPLGALPPNFNHHITCYDHSNILKLIIFYNEDFGIVQGDTVPIRIEKFCLFLSEI